jgi:hypothetical protein
MQKAFADQHLEAIDGRNGRCHGLADIAVERLLTGVG